MSADGNEIIEAGNAFANTFLQAGVAAWGVLIGKDISFEPGKTEQQTATEALAQTNDKLVISTINLSGSREGTIHLVLPELGAKCVVAPMMALMSGEETAPENTDLDDEGMDAYSEAVNNLVGGSAQALRQEIADDLKLINENTRLVDMQASTLAVELGTDSFIHHTGKVIIEGMEPFSVSLLCSPSVTGIRSAADSAATAPGSEPEADGKDINEITREHALKLKVPVKVILAKKKLRMEVIQTLSPGSIIEFRKQSSELLDLCVGKVKIAEGEVIITNQHFGIQVKRMVDIRAAIMAGATS